MKKIFVKERSTAYCREGDRRGTLRDERDDGHPRMTANYWAVDLVYIETLQAKTDRLLHYCSQ